MNLYSRAMSMSVTESEKQELEASAVANDRTVTNEIRARLGFKLASYSRKDGAGHGIRSAYLKGCRCARCIEVNRAYMRAWHAKRSNRVAS